MNKRDNVRYPVGDDGKKTLLHMNEVHNAGALWAIGNLKFSDETPLKILEIGCGGGANLLNFKSKFKSSKILGIDYSPTSVELSKQTASEFIKSGDIEVKLMDVNKLNLSGFDLVSAFETIYFWDDIKTAFANIYNALNDGGVFLVYVESVDKATLKEWSVGTNLVNQLDEDEIYSLLKEAKFSKIDIYQNLEKRCFLAYKL
ncbi:MAG: class I SAM-dependent methyltransferase [Campylobacter sp.]|nr:class I SAM-dependent methyltransferase [Campylobacter sp.]